MLTCSRVAAVLFIWVLAAGGSSAQEDRSMAPLRHSSPAITLHTTTRMVLTDVTVTDAHGNPVQGLKRSDFHIFDDGKPQTIQSFTEHRTTPVAEMANVSVAPGVYSNSFLNRLPPVLNIILIDTTNLEIVDQMYLRYKLDQFIKHLPPGEPLAVYLNTGPHAFLLQNFTSDHALLLNAIHEAIPRFPPTGREYFSDLETLYKVAVNFDGYPGRKNILWFSGGSTLFLIDNPSLVGGLSPTLGGLRQEDPAAQRAIYDLLQIERIAVYPVDARGLMTAFGAPTFYSRTGQQALMDNAARATGGHAYYNNNDLDLIAERWVHNSGDFYTLTYSPSNFKMNNKWHDVSVKLNAGVPRYKLSYRRGYFADGSIASKRASMKWRRRLLAHGGTADQQDLDKKPIIFEAEIKPASEMPAGAVVAEAPSSAKPKRGTVAYVVRYELPARSFATQVVKGKTEIVLGVGVIAFRADGSKDAGIADRVTLSINPEKLRLYPDAELPVYQRITLRKGLSYLYLAAWDMNSGRIGTLQIPVQVADAARSR